ncbi:hypothetical protein DZB91_24070 [Brevibacillus sp. VP]|uniref:VirB4 family type IV secretion system protein n=1 Tax=Brevibacillus sp. VP TaxID=2293326 RepID=UPI000E2E9CC8|nr:hypothetical protein [Brevibacillus sp. VP]RFB28280.1 hypothetical protein DZB91_24070 [Brevibacillus sp. VP]
MKISVPKLLGFQKKKLANDTTRQALPILSFGDVIQTRDNKYKILCRVSPINGELLSKEDLEEVIEAIQAALNSFNGRVQILIGTERVNIDRNVEYFEKKIKDQTREIYMELLEQQKNHIESMANKSRTILNFHIILESNSTKYQQAVDELTDSLSSIQKNLESKDMVCIRLEKDDISKLLYEKLNPETSYAHPWTPEINQETIAPKQMIDRGRYLENDGRMYKFLTIVDYPKSVKGPRWLESVFKVRGNMDISFFLNPRDKTEMQKKLSNSIQELRRKLGTEKLPEYLIKEIKDELEDADYLLDEMGGENQTLWDVTVVIAVSATSKEELDSTVKRLQNAISGSRCISHELSYYNLEPLWCILPIVHNTSLIKHYKWPMPSSLLASIVPFDSSELHKEDGVFICENATSNGLVIYNRFNKGEGFKNPNEVIVGESGSGKSFKINCDVLRMVPFNDFTIVIDPEREYNKFPFGTRIIFSARSQHVTNPFHIRSTILDSDDESQDDVTLGDYLQMKILDLMVFFKWIITDLKPEEEGLLEEDIRDTYAAVGLTFKTKELPKESKYFPTLDTFKQVVMKKINQEGLEFESNSRKRYLAICRPYIEGAYSGMFNGHTNWEFDFLTILDIHELSETVQKPFYDLLLKDIWEVIKRNRKERKGLYVDEAHLLADEENPLAMKFLQRINKRIRKYGGYLTVATQNLDDFMSIGKWGTAIINNSFFKTLMTLGPTDQKIVKDLFRLSPKEMKVISKQMGSGRAIHIAGSQRLEMQTRASEYELEIIEPELYYKMYGKRSRYEKKQKDEHVAV